MNQEISMESRSSVLWVVAVLCAPTLAQAHPGHGHTDPRSPSHYAIEPVHVVPVVIAVAALVIAMLTVYLAWRGGRKSD
jgi:hypothetical protein